MQVADLTPAMKGRIISVNTDDGVTITGPLRAIHLETEWIEDSELGRKKKTRMAGATWISIDVGRWSSFHVDPETPVDVFG